MDMGAGSGGGGGGGGGGGTGGTKKWYTSTCRSLIICDTMNIESSKIMLSEVRQLLHITLAIPVTSATAAQNDHFLPLIEKFTMTNLF